MTFIEFEQLYFDELPLRNPKLRSGQFLMILLNEVWPLEYNRIVDMEKGLTTIDCFYNDRLIPNTLNYLKKVWYEYPN